MKRSQFLKITGVLGVSTPFVNCVSAVNTLTTSNSTFPISINTWNFPNAATAAGEILFNGGKALDAVEKGVMVEEANIKNTTVGNGGAPDREGNVTLDASIMSSDGKCGSVAYLQNIQHPISVARKIMEETPHVMLVGDGAYNFAIQSGFNSTNLLSKDSEKDWKDWLKDKNYKPIINIENHDTIGMLAIDQNGDLAGACTTSGLAYKMQGRVGDSPIIGSGLFLDNEVGGAVATGMGEEIMKNVSSFLIVELMRQGKTPQEACEIAIKRIVKNSKNFKDFQVGLIAINKAGLVGSFSIHSGFTYVINKNGSPENIQSASWL